MGSDGDECIKPYAGNPTLIRSPRARIWHAKTTYIGENKRCRRCKGCSLTCARVKVTDRRTAVDYTRQSRWQFTTDDARIKLKHLYPTF
jgi:hypothetical protein